MNFTFTLTEPDREEDWVFMFGHGQKHAGHYVVIPGKLKESRDKMFEAFGAE